MMILGRMVGRWVSHQFSFPAGRQLSVMMVEEEKTCLSISLFFNSIQMCWESVTCTVWCSEDRMKRFLRVVNLVRI